jgi:hypothetical protein
MFVAGSLGLAKSDAFSAAIILDEFNRAEWRDDLDIDALEIARPFGAKRGKTKNNPVAEQTST